MDWGGQRGQVLGPLHHIHVASYRSHCQDAMTTTAEHFKPLWLPDGRSILPRHIHQPQSGYLQDCPPSCLRVGIVSPQHMRLHHSRARLVKSRWTDPLQPGMDLGCWWSLDKLHPQEGLGLLMVLGPAPSPRGFWGARHLEVSSFPMGIWGVCGPGVSSIPMEIWGVGGSRTSSITRRVLGCQWSQGQLQL